MSAREQLKFLILTGMACLLMGAAHAAIDADINSAGSDSKATRSDRGDNATTCVDLSATCSTLMVNYHGDSVKFALFQRGRSNGKADTADSTASALNENNEQLLGIDFLRGFEGDRGGSMHDWAFAAAKSMDSRVQRSTPDGNSGQGSSDDGSLTFWDFEYVYQWEVAENVLDGGLADMSQVVLSDIYLSSKVHSSSDPEVVVCEVNDANDCRPLSQAAASALRLGEHVASQN